MAEWLVPDGETRTVASGDTLQTSGVNLAGQLNLAGQMNVGSDPYEATSAQAAGADVSLPNGAILRDKPFAASAGASVSLPTIPTRTATAAFEAGAAAPFQRSILFSKVALDAGAETDFGGDRIARSAFVPEAGAVLSGRGTAFADTATLPAEAGAAVAADGQAIRSGATLNLFSGAELSGVPSFRVNLVLNAEASADLPLTGTLARPAVRRDEQGLAWQEDEEIDLTLDDPTG